MYLLKVKNRDYLRISAQLGIICICGLFISLYLYDEIINRIICWVKIIFQLCINKNLNCFFLGPQQITLVPKTIARKMYLSLPFPLEFHLHIFDIQNPEEVQYGGKPQLTDIGPYVFQ